MAQRPASHLQVASACAPSPGWHSLRSVPRAHLAPARQPASPRRISSASDEAAVTAWQAAAAVRLHWAAANLICTKVAECALLLQLGPRPSLRRLFSASRRAAIHWNAWTSALCSAHSHSPPPMRLPSVCHASRLAQVALEALRLMDLPTLARCRAIPLPACTWRRAGACMRRHARRTASTPRHDLLATSSSHITGQVNRPTATHGAPEGCAAGARPSCLGSCVVEWPLSVNVATCAVLFQSKQCSVAMHMCASSSDVANYGGATHAHCRHISSTTVSAPSLLPSNPRFGVPPLFRARSCHRCRRRRVALALKLRNARRVLRLFAPQALVHLALLARHERLLLAVYKRVVHLLQLPLWRAHRVDGAACICAHTAFAARSLAHQHANIYLSARDWRSGTRLERKQKVGAPSSVASSVW